MTKQKSAGAQQNSKQEKVCFVIAPIGEDGSPERLRSDQMYKHVIAPVVKEFDYRPERADMITSPGIITNQIMDMLFNSTLVIADLTDQNPNVFYELALRHAFAKPVIPILKSGQRIPFDNNQVRTIFYDHNDLDSIALCKESLSKSIQAVEGGDLKISNPVTHVMEYEKLKESTDPEVTKGVEMMTMLSEMGEEVRSLKNLVYQNNHNTSSQLRIVTVFNVVLDRIARMSTKIKSFQMPELENLDSGAVFMSESLNSIEGVTSDLKGIVDAIDELSVLIGMDKRTRNDVSRLIERTRAVLKMPI